MTRILVNEMPQKAEECPFFAGYRKQDEKIIGHKCILINDTRFQVDVSKCNYLMSVNVTKPQ